jgi:hypothetical protein
LLLFGAVDVDAELDSAVIVQIGKCEMMYAGKKFLFSAIPDTQ